MSNIYIQEPPALGKVLLKTTVGDIDLELWTKEAPKACRNFIQLCMEGYYNGTIFHRVVPDFIVQGGDPKGDGTGGESIYGAPFKDEFHTRLRFNRRGLVAMANAGKDDNGSQFFFTLNTTPELQNKHTIFGKVTGETVYNMLKLAEGDIDHNERPAYPHKITGCQVLINPFEDIVPRIKEKQEEVVQPKKKKDKGVKNYGLLSFGMEAEEEEDQSTEFRGKPKSTHDLLNDPKLSKLSAVEAYESEEEDDDDEKLSEDNVEEEPKITVESVRNKMLQKKADLDKRARMVKHCGEDKSDEEIEEYYLGKDKKEERKKKLDELRKEVKKLKKEMTQKNNSDSDDDKKEDKKKQHFNKDNEMVQQYEEEQEKYKKKLEKIPKKGASREEFTLALLNKFKKKLSNAKEQYAENEDKKDAVDDPENVDGDDWMAHKLHFEEKGAILAKDASTKGDDWYDIYDPRNPINKRKREAKDGQSGSKSKKS